MTERAAQVAKQKNDELPDGELADVARVVGIGAIKYNDLSRDRQQDIHFDIDKALALEGNTAPYMQYAYARLRSIARKAQNEGAATADSGRSSNRQSGAWPVDCSTYAAAVRDGGPHRASITCASICSIPLVRSARFIPKCRSSKPNPRRGPTAQAVGARR